MNRNKWAANAIAAYRFRFDPDCFCAPGFRPVFIEVQDGVRTSIVAVEPGAQIDTLYFEDKDTIEELFDIVQEALDLPADTLSVTYDSLLGYPARIDVDYYGELSDDEVTYSVCNFTTLDLAGHGRRSSQR